MNILVTGALGQLGREMRIVAKELPDHSFFYTDIIETEGTQILDICNAGAVCDFVNANHIDCIVNCAAYTNVDKAESDEATAEILNAVAPRNLAEALGPKGLLIHISTDYVFGGEVHSEPIKETENPCPTGVYGRTKLLGEQYIQQSGTPHVIIRTAWLYSEFGKNFVKTISSLIASKPSLKVVDDQRGTPTYALDLAYAVKAVIEKYSAEGADFASCGTYHFTNGGECTWFDFACRIAKEIHREDFPIAPCTSDEFPSPTKRPEYSVLDKTKISQTFGITIAPWEERLTKCIKNLCENQ